MNKSVYSKTMENLRNSEVKLATISKNYLKLVPLSSFVSEFGCCSQD